MEKIETVKPQVKTGEDIGNPQATTIEQHTVKLVNKIDMNKPNDKKSLVVSIVASLVVMLAGVGTGYKLSRPALADDSSGEVASVADNLETTTEEQDQSDKMVGEGILLDGGTEGQGRYTLQTEDGEDIALISSLIPLESFIDKEVQIWGEDVSKIEDLKLVDVSKVKVLK